MKIKPSKIPIKFRNLQFRATKIRLSSKNFKAFLTHAKKMFRLEKKRKTNT